jgi:hypothetical protein
VSEHRDDLDLIGEAIARLDSVCLQRGWDYGVRLTTAAESPWSAEVSVTCQPLRSDAHRSMVSVHAEQDPGDALAQAVADALEWAIREAAP